MSIAEQVNSDIKAAMLAKDKVRLEALRNIKKVFIEAQTSASADNSMDDATATKIIQKLVKQGKDTAAIYQEQSRDDLASVELEQVAHMSAYLPQAMSEEELHKAVEAMIAQVGATSMKDMGKVMGVASKELAGKAEGGEIAAKVKELLS